MAVEVRFLRSVEVNIQLTQALKQAPQHGDMGSGGIAPRTLSLVNK
jgi:hypothetical protein